MRLSKNAETVLKKRDYLKRDASGKVVESPDQMFKRVANAIAAASGSYGEDVAEDAKAFYRMMVNFEFLPNSPTLMHAGRNGVNQLAACFVLPIEDNLESIFQTLHDAAVVLRTGGGVGFSFSRLRSRGSLISTTGGVASGPVSFMELFDHMAQVINEGSSRRVAMMGILRVDHPDIEEFIRAKSNQQMLNNFNVSVGITDEFMQALKENKKYGLVDPHTKRTVKQVSAQEVFEQIVKNAWEVADPGLVFLDRMNEACPIRHLGEIEATNPCGEQPLLPHQSCNLGSINLSKFVEAGPEKESGNSSKVDKGELKSRSDSTSKAEKRIDWDRLEKAVRLAVKFLDNVIDVCDYPLLEVDQMSSDTRKIGLGVMGFADMLFSLGAGYDSKEGLRVADKVAGFIKKIARDESVKLGKARGSFPKFEGSRWQKEGFEAMRNSTLTTIAPTGTISIIASCSSGIEPIFALAFIRRNILEIGKTELVEFNVAFRRELNRVVKGRKRRKEILDEVAASGSCRDIEELSEELRKVFVTSHDVSWEWHVKMQAQWQKHIDSAVSKTINLPQDATYGEVERAYRKAYQSGCMGITIYRDKSRTQQVLNLGKKKKSGQISGNDLKYGSKKKLNGEEERRRAGHDHKKIVVMNGEEGICPDCRAPMVFQDGCATCPQCAYSYCSV